MARLELQEICKGFDEPVLDRLSLTVEEGEFFVVVGPSGIGKTTLLRCVAGLEVLDAGRVLIGGTDVTRIPPYRRRVAMTFESYALYPHLTVFENIASPLRARKADRAALERRVGEVARLLRIDQLLDRKPHEISGGQKQRTALGRTLVAEPDIFLLDEPISHLDAKIRHELRRQFHTLEELRRVATIYVTHDYAEALSLGDRIGIMGRGGLEQVGTAREVFQRPTSLFVARHMGQPSINELACELAAEGDAVRAVAGGGSVAFAVAPAHRAALNGGTGRLTVGIRPQHIAVLPEGAAADGRQIVEARVEIFEALGATGVLIAETGGVSLTALTSPDARFEPGQPIRLGLATDSFLYFGADGGRNLHG
ncbi:MAG: ABC transporter ATP-binding protein [Inquilinus sp.]|nr:ABC transporter ATP-binding protein [Inquilinus sp.]